MLVWLQKQVLVHQRVLDLFDQPRRLGLNIFVDAEEITAVCLLKTS